MVSLVLKPHDAAACPALRRIDVEATRRDGGLELHYRALGEPLLLKLPPPARAVHTDGLWAHTCFEAFLRLPGLDAYEEFNLAPSGAWAAYRFSGYREGMAPLEIAAPRIRVTVSATALDLSARLELPHLPPGLAWTLGLAAVIETRDGARSYWALAHAPGTPDFHHSAAFAGTLPPETP